MPQKDFEVCSKDVAVQRLYGYISLTVSEADNLSASKASGLSSKSKAV